MVADYGMSAEVGPLSFGHEDANAFWTGGPKMSSGTAEKIDQEVLRLLNEAHGRADQILRDKRELLDSLSALLLVVETIDGADLQAYASGTKQIPDPADAKRQLDERSAAAIASRPATPIVHPTPAPAPFIPPAPPLPAD
jgi:cell division protease FtsH